MKVPTRDVAQMGGEMVLTENMKESKDGGDAGETKPEGKHVGAGV